MTSRIVFMGRYLEAWDSIDFALGLRDYDIVYCQPHFPGYPVYMSLCRWLLTETEAETSYFVTSFSSTRGTNRTGIVFMILIFSSASFSTINKS